MVKRGNGLVNEVLVARAGLEGARSGTLARNAIATGVQREGIPRGSTRLPAWQRCVDNNAASRSHVAAC